MKRLLSKPELTTADRLSLYGSTILFQWLIVAIVAWRCVARTVDPDELGLAACDPWQVAWTSIALTGLLCANQVVGLRRITKLPEGKRGSVFAITEKIMPRNPNGNSWFTQRLPARPEYPRSFCTADLCSWRS